MNRHSQFILGLLATTLVAGLSGLTAGRLLNAAPDVSGPPYIEPMAGATLLDGLGDYRFEITSGHPDVQRWFDQGLMLTWGFNHDAAERSFLKATELDPDCAMCWWGAALVVGPHVNAEMDPQYNQRAWHRLQRAQALAPEATPREQAFIQALGARYAADPPEDRQPLEQAWADATGRLVEQRPDDLDAAVFHAEALMNLQPWDFYDEDFRPKGNTTRIVSLLESVIERNGEHPGALHLYIHAVEASAEPERGVRAADRLRDLIPGSGHLVHMPAHIYARVGRWNDAVIANQRAIEADEAYLAVCRGNAQGVYPLGYVPHNHHFLWFAASMGGQDAVAREAAAATAQRTELPDLMREPGFGVLQHYWMTPWFDHVRFGRWDEIAGRASPAPDLPYVTAVWHYAQAMAALRQDRSGDARSHAEALRSIAGDPGLQTMLVWDRYPLAHAARIASLSVDAELALESGDIDAGVAKLREAVAVEDAIPYDEPPGWHSPVRHRLGAVLLEKGDAGAAEAVYREELRRNPGNGWSLKGLALSLQAQGMEDEASTAEREFQAAWRHADVQLAASHF